MTTLKELATILNVSVSTVSKALNDSPEIGEDTKRRVKQLAAELDYQPNRLAQQLKSNATKTIGVIIPTIINPFFAEVLHGIENYADSHQYDIITTISNESFDKEQRAIKMLARGSVDGFIVAAARETQMEQKIAHLQSILNNQIPLVMFDRVVDQINCAKVVVDDYESVYNATQNLIEKGRQHFVLFSNIADLSVGKLRSQGFQDALKDAGLTFDVVDLKAIDNLNGKILDYLKTHSNTDAIVSIDHLTGIVALNMAESLGKSIPTDIDIVGFGYTETPLLVNNKIAIIQQKGEAIGFKTTELLLEKIKHKEVSGGDTIVIPNGFNPVY
ncbi:LacI family transcriptional regulator [Paucihalobacter ruber]|uniref:LacI family transcriptional regulator n=1 Tax=Paucihalobacter ruber TaxID=2567861 RepID=A0A506PHS6_9FLAO|nr:LacI family DNA-binding transcriptional regulator [Paucihalobacter ruber]TPV33396.1 LacI family transcriptional regulator [Paucihalobacter ruber]